MNLKQAMAYAALKSEAPRTNVGKRKSAQQIAHRVYQLAAMEGRPVEGNAKAWGNKWLASSDFVLMEIEATAAALPTMPRNQNRVLREIHASAGDWMEPLVVDINKNNIGGTHLGYVPPVIVLDGKHRHQIQAMQGRSRVMAWVGAEAAKIIQARQAKIQIRACSTLSKSRLDAAMLSVARQDVADQSGSAPHGRMPTVTPTRDGLGRKIIDGHGAGVPGNLGSGGNSGPINRLASKKVCACKGGNCGCNAGAEPSPSDLDSPSVQSPGSGVGPRTKSSPGGKQSEMAQRLTSGRVGNIRTKN